MEALRHRSGAASRDKRCVDLRKRVPSHAPVEIALHPGARCTRQIDRQLRIFGEPLQSVGDAKDVSLWREQSFEFIFENVGNISMQRAHDRQTTRSHLQDRERSTSL